MTRQGKEHVEGNPFFFILWRRAYAHAHFVVRSYFLIEHSSFTLKSILRPSTRAYEQD